MFGQSSVDVNVIAQSVSLSLSTASFNLNATLKAESWFWTRRRSASTRKHIWRLLTAVKQYATILMSSHGMGVCEALFNRIAIFKKGGLAKVGTSQDLIITFGNFYVLRFVSLFSICIQLNKKIAVRTFFFTQSSLKVVFLLFAELVGTANYSAYAYDGNNDQVCRNRTDFYHNYTVEGAPVDAITSLEEIEWIKRMIWSSSFIFQM